MAMDGRVRGRRLESSIAIVTGGASGYGEATVHRLAAEVTAAAGCGGDTPW